MRLRWLSLASICLFGACSPGHSAEATAPSRAVIQPAASLPKTTPWDLKALSKAPSFQWLDGGKGKIRSLTYRALSYKGKPTSVFAYYATPGLLAGDASKDRNLPAVVLVHGGGGTAFSQWAQLWAKRGYAAIAMDLAGCREGKKRLPDGGPAQNHDIMFGTIAEPVENQWSYHAVANVILAHSLIRSFKEVDASRTALTGISWGGYLTCIVAGLDNRFAAAVPVYGCGYLHEGSGWLGEFKKMKPEMKARWVRLWDPSRYAGSASMPVFFVNGTNDFAYWLESYARTCALVKGPRNHRITVRMPHGHSPGWRPKEIGLFIDQHLRAGVPLPLVARTVVADGKARADVQARTTLVSAKLNYTTATGNNPSRKWLSAPARIEAKSILADLPPGAKIWNFTVTDDRGATVSSELVFAK